MADAQEIFQKHPEDVAHRQDTGPYTFRDGLVYGTFFVDGSLIPGLVYPSCSKDSLVSGKIYADRHGQADRCQSTSVSGCGKIPCTRETADGSGWGRIDDKQCTAKAQTRTQRKEKTVVPAKAGTQACSALSARR